MSAALRRPAVRVLVYVGDVFEESLVQGRRLADEMGAKGIKLIVLHDTADPSARRDAEVFWDLAKRTGGCVLPFEANASGRLRDILSAVAVYAVGGEKLLRERRQYLPGATALLENLGTHSPQVD
jgi:L-alanine-DL-glutamate epimerase-like enolase superfamily enzyme